MCGIVGFSRDPARPIDGDAAIVRWMLQPIAHRGPDGDGIHVAGPIALGHLRLSIIDLAGGRQPRVDPATGDALIFNGEIYGYTALARDLAAAGVHLADRSDTEVLFRLLQRKGVQPTLDLIDGMFAFAFFEGRSGRLYLARDRFGEKPLYWCERAGVLIFGSEPRAVLAHPVAQNLTIDLGAVRTFLHYEYLPGTQGFHCSLRKLAPGQLLIWDAGEIDLRSYWTPEPDEAGSARAGESESDKLDRLDELFDTSVRDRLIADVPVGVFLSGGIDSSLVAALVGKHAPGLTAFTVRMPESSYDETPAAKALAQSLHLTHELIDLDDAAITRAFDALVGKMDEPFADASLLPTWLLCHAARQRVTVALGGDGADELFAGYISFKANRAAAALAVLPGWLGRACRQLLATMPQGSSYMSIDFLLRQLSQSVGLKPARQWAACMAPFAPEELERLWRPDVRKIAEGLAEDPITVLMSTRNGRRWSTAELIRLFISTYLPEDILLKVDRAAMYVSLEVRAPFLSRAFGEYAMSMPSRDKINGLSTKYLFRKLALRHIPREIVERKKHGFGVPLSRLLRGSLKEPVGAVLLDRGSPLHAWFHRREIERIWSAHQSGADQRKKIWTLFTLAVAANANAATARASHQPSRSSMVDSLAAERQAIV
jgi:asparagine synthase (glutamine-hydrolysing)